MNNAIDRTQKHFIVKRVDREGNYPNSTAPAFASFAEAQQYVNKYWDPDAFWNWVIFAVEPLFDTRNLSKTP